MKRLFAVSAILAILGLAFGGGNTWAEEKGLGDLGFDPIEYQLTLRDYSKPPYKDMTPTDPAFDWRDYGIVTPAKDQGSCGSCWAFACVGVMESKILLDGGPVYDLSEQQQVSCNSSYSGCCGGSYSALQYWYTTGPWLESCTGYGDYSTSCPTQRNVSCGSLSCSDLPYRTANLFTVNTSSVNDVKTSIDQDGPAYFRFTVYSDFYTYWSTAAPGDVYTQSSGSVAGGHAILIIGWDNAKAAWLCKNSWGATGGPNNDGTLWMAWTGHASSLSFGMANVDRTLNTYYVGPNPGDDFSEIQPALDMALSGDSIIVRDGTYAGSGNKSLDFGGKAIVLRSENGPESCVIDCEDTGLAFNFHNNETSTSVVNGFKIVDGGPDSTAGIQCSNSSPTIKSCIISGNTSQTGGGGIACWDSSPTIINCTITENEAGIGPGGGILCSDSSSPVIINCTISGNAADIGGGIASDMDSSPTLTNCILWNNSATLGPEIALTSSLTPSSLTISYSDVEGGQAAAYVDGGCNLIWGDGNTNANPLFVGGGDYHLTPLSPCVNAGTDAGVYTDIDGDVRPLLYGFDMGSDECTQEPPGIAQIYLTYPPDDAVVFLPPTFMWTAVGGTNNVFAVDFSLSYPITRYWSTYENIGQLIRNESWTPSTQLWNRLPSGYVWWRVRGADLDQTPLAIITSEDSWFYKW